MGDAFREKLVALIAFRVSIEQPRTFTVVSCTVILVELTAIDETFMPSAGRFPRLTVSGRCGYLTGLPIPAPARGFWAVVFSPGRLSVTNAGRRA
jgi:hypothetical protein